MVSRRPGTPDGGLGAVAMGCPNAWAFEAAKTSSRQAAFGDLRGRKVTKEHKRCLNCWRSGDFAIWGCNNTSAWGQTKHSGQGESLTSSTMERIQLNQVTELVGCPLAMLENPRQWWMGRLLSKIQQWESMVRDIDIEAKQSISTIPIKQSNTCLSLRHFKMAKSIGQNRRKTFSSDSHLLFSSCILKKT